MSIRATLRWKTSKALALAARGGVACADALAAAILAPHCAACGVALDCPRLGPVCAGCWNAVGRLAPPLCQACGDPLPSWRTVSVAAARCPRCRRSRRAVDAARSVGDYEGSLRSIIHAFKYGGRRSLARPLARLLRESGADLLAGSAFVVPVPLHPWRRFRRGFNQAADLCRHLGVPVSQPLARVRATMPQTGLTARARRRNVARAFGPSPWLTASVRRRLQGATLVLVDDVKTTGATLEACAEALKALGVREVRALTVARAAPPGPGRG